MYTKQEVPARVQGESMRGMRMAINGSQKKRIRETGNGRRQVLGGVLVWLTVLVVALPVVVAAATAAEPTVIVSDSTVTPAVLMPGDTGTVTLMITNTAQAASEKENAGAVAGGTFASSRNTDINVFIENIHLDENGIIVETDDFDRIGELGPGQSVPVTFVIRAPQASGIYFPEAWIDVRNGRSTRFPVMVNVNTDIATQKKPALSVARSVPVQVTPGDGFNVSITLANTGLTRAGDVTVVVDPGRESVALASTGRYYIPALDPGETHTIDLQFASDKSVPVGICPVTLAITYANIDGSTEKQTEILGIPFKGKAEIAVSSVTTDPVRPAPGSPFTLIVRVENTGTGRATSVRATLDTGFSGTKDAFIGSVDKDSDAPAIFSLQATRDGSVPATITITYNDDYGPHTLTERTTVTTAPSSMMTVVAIVLAVLAAGGIVAYWYFRVRPGKTNGA